MTMCIRFYSGEQTSAILLWRHLLEVPGVDSNRVLIGSVRHMGSCRFCGQKQKKTGREKETYIAALLGLQTCHVREAGVVRTSIAREQILVHLSRKMSTVVEWVLKEWSGRGKQSCETGVLRIGANEKLAREIVLVLCIIVWSQLVSVSHVEWRYSKRSSIFSLASKLTAILRDAVVWLLQMKTKRS